MKSISPKEVAELLKHGKILSIIDVREAEEVAEGMIPGALHIPLGELSERYIELDRDTEHIIVCMSGRRSERACQFLEQQGVHVMNMDGGMLRWEAEVKLV